jgi:putative flippase GtrA
MIKFFFAISKKIRYLLVGGFNTLFSFALFSTAYYFFEKKIAYQVILVFVNFIGVFVSFVTLKFFVFQTSGNFWREYFKCNISYLILLTLNLIILSLFVEYLKMNVLLSQLISIIVIAAIGLVIHERFSFRIKKYY